VCRVPLETETLGHRQEPSNTAMVEVFELMRRAFCLEVLIETDWQVMTSAQSSPLPRTMLTSRSETRGEGLVECRQPWVQLQAH